MSRLRIGLSQTARVKSLSGNCAYQINVNLNASRLRLREARRSGRLFMVGRRVQLFLGVVFPLTMAATAAAGQDPSAQAGSVYPADVVPAPERASQQTTGEAKVYAVTVAAPNTQLAEALGPAGYILGDIGAGENFRALIRNAVGRHPAFHRQVSALDQSRAGGKRARAALYPQLSTSISADYALTRSFDNDTDNVVESLRPGEQYSASLSASQLVFDGGASLQRIKSAKARHSEFENAISTRINGLSIAALTAYHDLLTHQALLALGDAYIRRHQKILEDVKERERLGAGSRADVMQATARLAAARARVAEIRESERLAEIRYEEFFGERAASLVRPAFDGAKVGGREAASMAALQHSPEIAAADARADASRADYKAAKGARLPEVRVSVDAVKYDLFNGGDDYDVRAGVNLNYNIFGGGARAADIAEAASVARQERFSAEQVRREVARDAAIAYERLEGANERLASLETAVIAHNQTRDLVLERYRVARGDLIDVLQSENDYFEAGVAYLTGLANRDMATYALMEHTGDLLRNFSPSEEYAGQTGGDVDG